MLFNYEYLPIAVPHLLWCHYVLQHYKKIYIYTDERQYSKIFSASILINLIFCVLVGMFWPQYWIWAIGWGGLIQNVKTNIMAKDKGLNDVAKEVLMGRVVRTYFNMGATFLLGLIFVEIIQNNIFSLSLDVKIAVLYGLAFLYIYAGIVLYQDHISVVKSTFIRGLIKRRVLEV